MLIDVSSILKEVGGRVEVSGNINVDNIDFLGESFHFNSLIIEGEFVNNGKSLILSAHVKAEVNVLCARCRKPITCPIEYDIDETFIQGYDGEDEDIYVFTGHEIDVDEVVYNNFFMNASGKYLCSEDCKGLCPKCGADLNMGDCGCSDDDIDPRWEKLISIMNNTEKE